MNVIVFNILFALDGMIDDEAAQTLPLLETVAEWYSADLKQKVSRSRQRRAELGLYNGDLPFGYRKHPESVEGNPLPPLVDTDEAEIVRMAYRRYVAGVTSMAAIAREINVSGAVTRNKRKQDRYGLTGPRPWTKESVKDTLSNPFYRGLVSYRGALKPGRHEAIIDEPTWREVEAMRQQRRRGGRSYSAAFRSYELKGVAHCANCGERLWANMARGHAYSGTRRASAAPATAPADRRASRYSTSKWTP